MFGFTSKLSSSIMRLFGLDWVLKEVRLPTELDSAQCEAWFKGLPRTSKLKQKNENISNQMLVF